MARDMTLISAKNHELGLKLDIQKINKKLCFRNEPNICPTFWIIVYQQNSYTNRSETKLSDTSVLT